MGEGKVRSDTMELRIRSGLGMVRTEERIDAFEL